MQFDWILFDLDDTLFHFDAFAGMKRMFAAWDVPFTTEDFKAYQQVNKQLWVDYQDGKINSAQLRHRRFTEWSLRLNKTTQELNHSYFAAMTEISTPLDGAEQLLAALAPKARLGIVTNGFTELQNARLKKWGMQDYFQTVVVSEEIGVAKPAPQIFDHALAQTPDISKQRVMMVGDNLHSDILGGRNAGLKTCWLNPEQKPVEANIQPDYQVRSLPELQTLLLG